MFETRYEISDDDGVFRLGRDNIGLMLGEILKLNFIHHIDATALGPLIIVRRSLEDTDQEDPVLSILARYGIVSAHLDERLVRHRQCRSTVEWIAPIEPSCPPLGIDTLSAGLSWSDIP
jgi:hypothetical protein